MTGIKFKIDDVEVEAQAGQTIMQAADAVGIYIPRICSMKGLSAQGSCRVCTVMVNGRPAGSLHPAGYHGHGCGKPDRGSLANTTRHHRHAAGGRQPRLPVMQQERQMRVAGRCQSPRREHPTPPLQFTQPQRQHDLSRSIYLSRPLHSLRALRPSLP